MTVKILKTLIIFFFLFSLLGCNSEEEEEYRIAYSQSSLLKKKVYIFGVHPLHNPTKLFEVYQPFVEYINKRLVDVELKLEASRNYGVYDKKLLNSYFDLALPNPYQTIMALKKGYKVFGKMGDDKNFRGIIILRKDSNINEVQDLKGKKVSYPAPTALAATMLPQYFLHQKGLDINSDITNLYVGSQESSIMNVYLKKSSAASTWPPPWFAFQKERPQIAKELIVKWKTKPLLNNALIAKQDFPQDILEKISVIIFDLHNTKQGQKILQKMELSHFEPADNKTYDTVKKFVEKFEKDIRTVRVQ